ncbi:unnamed protein product, partial [Discosporangium mesarthrocarpum]
MGTGSAGNTPTGTPGAGTPQKNESPSRWDKHSPPLPYPAVKRHCSPHRNTYSHSPEPSMAGITGSMAGLRAAPPSPGEFPDGPGTGDPQQPLPSLSAAAAGLRGIPTPPHSGYTTSSAALPPPHGAPRAHMPSHHIGGGGSSSRGPNWSGGTSTRPPRSPSPSSLAAAAAATVARERRGSMESSQSLSAGVGPGPSPGGGGLASGLSPGGGFSGVFSPGSAQSSAASTTGPSPSRSLYSNGRQLSAGGDTLEDLSILDPKPPTLERLKFFLDSPRSPRSRSHRAALERRRSDIILPIPHQRDPSPGSRSEGRPSFTASLFDQEQERF